MQRADVLTLISESPNAHGAFAKAEYAERTVFCTVRSVSRREVYEAMSAGLKPEMVFRLSNAAEYAGEKLCRFHGIDYAITRTYVTDDDAIELTVQRSNADA